MDLDWAEIEAWANTPTPVLPRTRRHDPHAPWADVEAWLAAHTRRQWAYQVELADRPYQGHLTDHEAATMLDCTSRSIIRWRNTGTIPLRSLEDIAGHLGVHPSELWAGYVDTIIELDGAA